VSNLEQLWMVVRFSVFGVADKIADLSAGWTVPPAGQGYSDTQTWASLTALAADSLERADALVSSSEQLQFAQEE
jgi:hypothetical protein